MMMISFMFKQTARTVTSDVQVRW